MLLILLGVIGVSIRKKYGRTLEAQSCLAVACSAGGRIAGLNHGDVFRGFFVLLLLMLLGVIGVSIRKKYGRTLEA